MNKLFNTIKKIGFVFGIGIITIFLRIEGSFVQNSWEYLLVTSKWTNRFLNSLYWLKINSNGVFINNSNPKIYVCSHLSYLDSLLIFYQIYENYCKNKVIVKLRLLSTSQFLAMPIIGKIFKYINCIFVNIRRSVDGEPLSTIKDGESVGDQMVQTIASGQSMWIFPEGRLRKNNKIDKIFSGAYDLHMKTRVELVFVKITGSDIFCPYELDKNFAPRCLVTIGINYAKSYDPEYKFEDFQKDCEIYL